MRSNDHRCSFQQSHAPYITESAEANWYNSSYRRPPIIGISGIIGAGKTTLAGVLSRITGYDLIEEPVASNPYLPLFYANRTEYSFAMQVYLLSSRFRLHQNMVWRSLTTGTGAIQDRTIYEDPIFALMLHKSRDMTCLDFETYSDLFKTMTSFLHKPDVLVYLDVSPACALDRVRRRGRECERSIGIGYLSSLRDGYEEWLRSGLYGVPVIRVEWTECNEAELETQARSILSRVYELIGMT